MITKKMKIAFIAWCVISAILMAICIGLWLADKMNYPTVMAILSGDVLLLSGSAGIIFLWNHMKYIKEKQNEKHGRYDQDDEGF